MNAWTETGRRLSTVGICTARVTSRRLMADILECSGIFDPGPKFYSELRGPVQITRRDQGCSEFLV